MDIIKLNDENFKKIFDLFMNSTRDLHSPRFFFLIWTFIILNF